MALRDTWHRALVYFGLAEDPEYRYEDEVGYDDEPETISQEAAPHRRRRRGSSKVRRLHAEDEGEIEDIFADEAPAARRGRLRPVGNGAGEGVRVHFVTPRNFNDAQEVADRFKQGVPVIINLQSAAADLSKRLIDFSSGMTYALDGGMQRIADKTFLLTPANVEVSAEEKARLVEKGFFNQS